jgi:predicted restriction endonuclease
MTDRSYRFKKAWRTTTRKVVLATTGGRCAFCGDPGTDGHGKGLHQAHLIPHSQGGPDDPGNLVPLCARCHRSFDNQTRIVVT